MTPNLKLLCTQMVMESELSNPSKVQLLKFIRFESDESRLKAFLLDGQIVNLDEQSKQIVNERFEISNYPEMLDEAAKTRTLRKSLMTRYGSILYLGIPWTIYRKIRATYDNCTKKCGTFELNTKRRQYCMAKCKVDKLNTSLKNTKDQKAKYDLNEKLRKAIQTVKDYEKDAKDRDVTLNP